MMKEHRRFWVRSLYQKFFVDRSLRHLYPFMNVETAEPQERIPGLDKDGAAGTTAPGAAAAEEIQDKFSQTKHYI